MTPPAAPAPRNHVGNRDVIARVDAELGRFLESSRRVLEGAGPELTLVASAAHDLVFAGGKRMRPLFAYWGWRCVCGPGAPGEAGLVQAAGALELLHAAALVHDDLIDRSDTRRGRPAAHTRMTSLHLDSAWAGSGRDFGAAAAILIGDLLLSWSSAMLAEALSGAESGAALPEGRRADARREFDAMATEMMAGQYLDVLTQAQGRHSVEVALRVARFKSSKYTVERPLHLGAAWAGASPAVRRALSDFGVPVGEAFQLRDDVLGVFGDPGLTGKPAGDDLREGKRTVLVALAYRSATPGQRALVDTTFGSPDLDLAGVDRLREVMVDTGALDAVERLIADRAAQGERALAEADVRPDARAALLDLATAAIERHH